jgi:hypothetical protein
VVPAPLITMEISVVVVSAGTSVAHVQTLCSHCKRSSHPIEQCFKLHPELMQAHWLSL